MILKYRVYSPSMNQFITEFNNISTIKYNVNQMAYEIRFTDDTKVFVPKEHDLNRDIISKPIELASTNEVVTEEYYELSEHRVALYKLDDIREAQLRLNFDCSIEQSNIIHDKQTLIALSDKVFAETLVDHDNEDSSILYVRAYNGNEIITLSTFKPLGYTIKTSGFKEYTVVQR